MQITTVPSTTGVQWLLMGWRLLRRQPLALPAMVVTYLMLLFLPALVLGFAPLLSVAVSALLSPFASVGLMQCVREVSNGRPPQLACFVTSFKETATRKALFQLGLINAALLVTVATLLLVIAPATPAASSTSVTPVTSSTATTASATLETSQPAVPRTASMPGMSINTLALQSLLYLPVLILMWFAPLLVAWHQVTPAKAMFGSAVAFWRNKLAILLYAVATLVLCLAAGILLVSPLALLVPSRDLLSFIVAPIALALITIIQASLYPMYQSIFDTPSLASAPAAA